MTRMLFILLILLALPAARAHELILDHDFPDPTVIKAADGHYYAYATQGTSEDSEARVLNLQLARSRDLKNWEHLGDALPVKPSWARSTQALWAPHIHHALGKYFLYYSAEPDTRDGLCLAVATSDSPRGPFVDSGKPLVCGQGFSNIDPMTYVHKGVTYLYWGSGFDPVRMRALDKTLLKFEESSPTVNLVAPDRSASPAPYTRLLEGAWVVKHGKYFYLFVSGENCCSGPDPKYAVLVLRSENFDGPYEYKNQDPTQSVVIESSGRFTATGHNAFITDSAGKLWTLYHGVDAERPSLAFPIPGDRTNRRVMLRRSVEFKDGWPVTQPERARH